MSIFMVAGAYLFETSQSEHPEIRQLQLCLSYLDANINRSGSRGGDGRARPTPEAEREALETYIAGQFRQTITDQETWNGFAARLIPTQHRVLAERIIAERAVPTEAELAAATTTLEPILKGMHELNEGTDRVSPVVMTLFQVVAVWLAYVAIPGLLAAIVFGRGLIMMLFGVRCVTRSGQRASRLRMLWRTLVLHAPAVMAIFVFLSTNPLKLWWAPVVFVGVGVLLLALVVWSLLLPTRGLADRLAGTFPVPG
jgi:hypothetical protein